MLAFNAVILQRIGTGHPDDVPEQAFLNKGSNRKGNDRLIGGKGPDHFHLSKGEDTIKNFSFKQGDQIVVPDMSTMQILQNADNVEIYDEVNKINTTLVDSKIDAVLAALRDSVILN